MGTPHWVRFAEISMPVRQVFSKALRPAYGMFGMAAFSSEGIETDALSGKIVSKDFEQRRCADIDKALQDLVEDGGLAVEFQLPGVGGGVKIFAWRTENARTIVNVDLDSSLLYAGAGLEPGDWIAIFISTICACLECDGAGFGDNDAYIGFGALDFSRMLAKLQSRSLYQEHPPSVFVFEQNFVENILPEIKHSQEFKKNNFKHLSNLDGYVSIWNIA